MKKSLCVAGVMLAVLVSGCTTEPGWISSPQGGLETGSCQFSHECGICGVCADGQCMPDECYTGTPGECCRQGMCICRSGSPAWTEGRYCSCL